MARTVADATILLNVIAGYDPADTVTALSQGRLPDDYTVFLDPTSIQGKRLGVLRQLFQQPDSQPNGPEPSIPQLTQDQESQTSPATKVHPEVLRLMDQALFYKLHKVRPPEISIGRTTVRLSGLVELHQS